MHQYFYLVGEAVQYLIAFASLMAFLGLILGIMFMIFGSSRYRGSYGKVIMLSIIVLALTGGLYTGIRYFRI